MIILLALLVIGGGVYWLTQRKARRADPPASVHTAPMRHRPSAPVAGMPAPGRGGRGRVVLSGLTKRFGERAAVDGLSFAAEPGRVTGFLGPNGAGKTTTMRMLLGLTLPNAGSATLDGTRYA